MTLVCASNCETCTGSATTDCTLCYTGFYAQPTTLACSSSCPNGYYADSTTRTCIQCDAACATCNDAGHTNCLTCSAQYYSSAANTCSPCDPLCDGCSGGSSAHCSACATGKFSLEGTTYTCLNDCSDVSAEYYLDGTVCKACDSACGSCGGAHDFNCITCKSPAIEYVDSTIKSPMHCITTCGVTTFVDATVCRDCASDCETCTGTATTDCSQCKSGYFAQPTTLQCLNTCPSGLFGNAVTRVCE